MRRRMLLGRLLLTAALAAGDLPAARRDPCDLRGPLSDFWPKVIRDWSRRIPGLKAGPNQTAAWVSLVYGTADPPGTDRGLEDFIRDWSRVQEWNWVRSEIWKRPYRRVAQGPPENRLGFRQNLILVGTPSSNPFLSRAFEPLGIRLEPDTIWISRRPYRGGDLLLIAIAPSPFARDKYALGVAGLSEEAIRTLERLPFGESDYVLFRGRRVVESGFFEKRACEAWGPARHPSFSPDHRGWEAHGRGALRYHFDPTRTRREEVEALAAEEEVALETVHRVLRIPRGRERMEIFLYASADDKLRETGNGRPMHLEEGASAVHRILVPGSAPLAYPAALLLIRQNLGARGSSGFRLALALAASDEFEGRPLEEWSAHQMAREGLPELSRVLQNGSEAEEADLLQALSAASFLRFLIEEGRVVEVRQLYLNSSRGSLPAHYRNLLGESLGQSLERWASRLAARYPSVSPTAPSVASRGPGQAVPEATLRLLERARLLFRDRRDAEARDVLEEAIRTDPGLGEAHVLLARIAFRSGDTEIALREARRALEAGGEDPAIRAWAHVTLGRTEAVRGHISAAELELRDPSVASGPDPPRLLADLWLENLGLSPNRKAVEEQLRREARADLQNFDWDSAERKLKVILASNPDDAEAHFALSEVYLRHHNYWVERATLSNELHPGTTLLDPGLYNHLADRANRELEKGMILSTPELALLRTEGNRHELAGSKQVAGLDLFDPSLRIEGPSPSESRHHFFQGRAYFFSAEWEKARQELELSLGHDGRNQRIVAWDLIYLGFIDLFHGRLEMAKARFGAARALRIGGRVAAAARKGLELALAREAARKP